MADHTKAAPVRDATAPRSLDGSESAVSQSSPITPLASAQINHDHVKVELVEPDSRPAMVRIVWPNAPTIVDPRSFPDTAATVAQLFARAHIVLAAIKAHEGPFGPQ
jgi:hypothetical protein